MDKRYEQANFANEGLQQNGDSFEQQIDQHISDLNKPFVGEGEHQYNNSAVSIQDERGSQQIQQFNNTVLKNSPNRPQTSQYQVREQKIIVQTNGRQIVEQRTLPIQQAGQQFYAQPHITRAQITINGRKPSPNRFYPEARSTGVVSTHITPPKPASVGIVLNHHHQVPPQLQQPVPNISNVRVENDHHPALIRSRVISQVQKPPIFYIPANVKPQSTNVIRSEERVRQISLQQATQFNRSLQTSIQSQAQKIYLPPTGSRLNQRPAQVITQSRNPSPLPHPQAHRIIINRPPQNFIQNPTTNQAAQQQQVPVNPHFPHPQTVQTVQHVQHIQSAQPLISQQQLVQIHQVITKYEHVRTEIKQFSHQTHIVTEMIKIMLAGEEEREKLDFIGNLMRQQTILEERLAALQRQIDDANDTNQQQSSEITNKQRSNTFQQSNSITTRSQIQPEIQSLRQKIQSLEAQNQNLLTKYLILQQQHQSAEEHHSSQQLLQTIQSQKAIIKRLEQQLISTNNQPISQQTRQNNDDAIKSLESKLMTIIDSKEAYINELQAEIIRHKTQIKSLKQQVLRERNQRNLAEQATEQLERQSHNNIKSNTQPNSNNNSKQLEKLQKLIKQKDEELDQIKQKIFQIQDEFDQTLDQRNQKIKQLHEQIMNISQRSIVDKKQQTEQISSQLQLAKNQLTNKSEELKKSKEKIGQLENAVKDLQNEKIKLSESLKEMTSEEDRLRQSLSSLEIQLKTRRRGDEEETRVIIQQLKKKQNELIKQKQIEDIHLNMIEDLERQLNGLKQGYKNMEVSMVEQRRLSTQKYTEYQNKIKLISSRGESQPRQQQQEVQKLQGVITQMRQKIKMLEDHQLQQSTATNQQDQRDFRLQYSHSQVKIFELENTLKERQNRIKQLQSNMETLRLKINHNTHTEKDIMMNQEIQMLRKKVEEYEASGKGTREAPNYLVRDYQSNSLFEQRVIYELKTENERLKNLVSKQDWKDVNSSTSSPQRNRTYAKNSKQQYSCIENIQFRLAEFNKKLNQIIRSNRQMSSMHSSHQIVNNQLVHVLQQEKIHMAKLHHRQIEALQARIVDLQRYCSSLEFREGIATFDYSSSLRQSVETQSKGIYAEQIEYYKDKNKELESRVDTLLSINKELKDKLAQYMKPQSEHNIEFYKQQMAKLEARILDLQNTIKALKDQKTTLVATIQKIQADKSAQDMIQSLEQSLHEQVIKAQKLQQQNSLLELQLKKYTQQVIDFSSENLGYKARINDLENKISSLEQASKRNNNQIEDSQATIVKLKNQIQILKDEIERLKEDLSKKKSDYEREVAGFKSKISDLQQQLRQLQSGIQTTEHDSFAKDQTINVLNSKILTLERNLTSQISKTTSLTQKLTTVQAQLTRVTSEKNDLALLVQKLNGEIAALTKKLKQMKQQKDKFGGDSLRNQEKISELEDILRRLSEQLELYKQSKAKLMQEKYQLEQEFFNKIADFEDMRLQFNKMKFHLEFIRSVFIEVQVLVSQIAVDGQERVIVRVGEEIGKGLASCEQICVYN